MLMTDASDSGWCSRSRKRIGLAINTTKISSTNRPLAVFYCQSPSARFLLFKPPAPFKSQRECAEKFTSNLNNAGTTDHEHSQQAKLPNYFCDHHSLVFVEF